jgi:DNA-directed RNA polymerase specialized sigma24 family protein
MVSAAIAGDEPAFAALAERHRRELHVHCYRMLASFDEAEDAVQETFLKAWRGRSGFEVGANRMPAAASYLRRPGDTEFRAFKLDVMRIEAGLIAEITTFNAELFAAFGLGPTL